MKRYTKRIISLIIAALLINQSISMSVFAQTDTVIGESSVIEAQNTISTYSVNGTAEVRTVDEFKNAISDPSVTTIIVKNHINFPGDNTDEPLIIGAEGRTITVEGSGNTLSLRPSGIVLGGDVVFKNVTLYFESAVRNAIIANGHSLTLENVQQGTTFTTSIFAGGISDFNGSITLPQVGSNSVITIKGNTDVDNIFAGSLSDIGVKSNGDTTELLPTKPNSFTGNVTINLEPLNNINPKIGSIYATGAREDRRGGNPNGIVEDQNNEILYKVIGDININLGYSSNFKIYSETDDSSNINISVNDSKGYQTTIELFNRLQGKFPNKIGSISVGNTSLILKTARDLNTSINDITKIEKSLDISNVNTSEIHINNFNGGGALGIGVNQTINIKNKVDGTTQVGIGGINFNNSNEIPSTSKIYIKAPNSKEGSNGSYYVAPSFELLPPRQDASAKFVRSAEGYWTVTTKASEESKIAKLSKFVVQEPHTQEISLSEFKASANTKPLTYRASIEFDNPLNLDNLDFKDVETKYTAHLGYSDYNFVLENGVYKNETCNIQINQRMEKGENGEIIACFDISSIDSSKPVYKGNYNISISPKTKRGQNPLSGTIYLNITDDTVPESHTHSWEYTASGDTITATCKNTGCDIKSATLKLNAPTNLVYDKQKKAATVENSNANVFNSVNIVYKNKVTGAEATEPINVGEYTANVTVGEATATVPFSITRATPSLTINSVDSVNYNGSEITTDSLKINATYTGDTETQISYKIYDAVSDGTEVKPINAGKYYIEAIAPETANYNAVVSQRVELSVKPITPIVTASTSASELLGGRDVELTISLNISSPMAELEPKNIIIVATKAQVKSGLVKQDDGTYKAVFTLDEYKQTGDKASFSITTKAQAPNYLENSNAVTTQVNILNKNDIAISEFTVNGSSTATSVEYGKPLTLEASIDPVIDGSFKFTVGEKNQIVTANSGKAKIEFTDNIDATDSLECRVEFTPSDSSAHKSPAPKAITVKIIPLEFVSQPPIIGNASYNSVLTVDTSNLKTLNSGALQFNYAWKRDGKAIDSATASTYTVAPEDIGKKITVELTEISGNFKPITSTEIIPTKAIPKASASAKLTAKYGQSLKDVSLQNPPQNIQGVWSWNDENTSVGEVGENIFYASFTPSKVNGIDVYEVLENVAITVVVEKAEAPNVLFPTASNIVYGDALSSAILSGGSTELGTFEWSNGKTVPTVKNNGYEVTFIPNEATQKNYKDISNKSKIVNVTVTKAKPTINAKAETIAGSKDSRTATIKIELQRRGLGASPSGLVTINDGKRDLANVNLENGVAVYTLNGLAEQEYTIRFTYSGDDNYDTSISELKLDTAKKNQEPLVLEPIGNRTYGDKEFMLVATGGSTESKPIFTSSDPTVISIVDNRATILKAGNTIITATKHGDDSYNDVAVSQAVTVNKKAVTVKAKDKDVYATSHPNKDTDIVYEGFVNDKDLAEFKALISLEYKGNEIVLSARESSKYEPKLIKGKLTIIELKEENKVIPTEEIKAEQKTPAIAIDKNVSLENGVTNKETKLVVYDKVTKEDKEKVETALPELPAVEQKILSSTNTKTYEINLVKTSDNTPVKITKGKVKVFLPYPSGVDSTYKIILKHYKDNKLIDVLFEKLSNGVSFETDSFSPFIMGWEKPVAPTPTPIPDSTPDYEPDERFVRADKLEERIKSAKKGEIVRAKVADDDIITYDIMRALADGGVRLVIEHNGKEYEVTNENMSRVPGMYVFMTVSVFTQYAKEYKTVAETDKTPVINPNKYPTINNVDTKPTEEKTEKPKDKEETKPVKKDEVKEDTKKESNEDTEELKENTSKEEKPSTSETITKPTEQKKSNTGLIVAIVIAVISIVGIGVILYLGRRKD